MKLRSFYEQLAYELVHNTYDAFGLRSNDPGPNRVPPTLSPWEGVGIHLTPTKKTKRHRNGTTVAYPIQHDFKVCKKHCTTKTRSECADVVFFCDTASGRNCFNIHYTACNDEED